MFEGASDPSALSPFPSLGFRLIGKKGKASWSSDLETFPGE